MEAASSPLMRKDVYQGISPFTVSCTVDLIGIMVFLSIFITNNVLSGNMKSSWQGQDTMSNSTRKYIKHFRNVCITIKSKDWYWKGHVSVFWSNHLLVYSISQCLFLLNKQDMIVILALPSAEHTVV